MKKVLIIDSGSGGVNVLKSCVDECANFNYLLYIDEKNLPYGEKSKQELCLIAKEIIDKTDIFFLSEIVVLACNSLTSVAIEYLRKEFPKKVLIGSCPAVKPAINKFNIEDILVIATQATVNNCESLKDFKKICFVPKSLPSVIDKNLFERDEIEKYLRDNLVLGDKKAIVLGCTHFEGIVKEIEKVFGDIQIFSSGKGIAKQLKKHCDDKKDFQVQIMSSGINKSSFQHYFRSLLN